MHIKMMVVDDAVSLTMNQILTESALTDNRWFGVVTNRPDAVQSTAAILAADLSSEIAELCDPPGSWCQASSIWFMTEPAIEGDRNDSRRRWHWWWIALLAVVLVAGAALWSRQSAFTPPPAATSVADIPQQGETPRPGHRDLHPARGRPCSAARRDHGGAARDRPGGLSAR